jgi:hypothetical protein
MAVGRETMGKVVHEADKYFLEEDRLFIPAEYVPLFVQAGWQEQV